MHAVPTISSASGNDDDATVTLRVFEDLIVGDSRSFCEVRLVDIGMDEPFTAGDKVFLWVYEDDAFSNDLIWETSFTVSAAEVSSNSLDRTFDCTADFDEDGVGDSEFFAEARVEKERRDRAMETERVRMQASMDVRDVKLAYQLQDICFPRKESQLVS